MCALCKRTSIKEKMSCKKLDFDRRAGGSHRSLSKGQVQVQVWVGESSQSKGGGCMKRERPESASAPDWPSNPGKPPPFSGPSFSPLRPLVEVEVKVKQERREAQTEPVRLSPLRTETSDSCLQT